MGMHDDMANSHWKLRRAQVWCDTCKRTERVDVARRLSGLSAWPECCGYTMTLDSPKERKAFATADAASEQEPQQ